MFYITLSAVETSDRTTADVQQASLTRSQLVGKTEAGVNKMLCIDRAALRCVTEPSHFALS